MTEEFTPPPRTIALHRLLAEVARAKPGTFGKAMVFTTSRKPPRHPYHFHQDNRVMAGARQTKMRELDALWLFDYGNGSRPSMYALRPLWVNAKGQQTLDAWTKAFGEPEQAEAETR